MFKQITQLSTLIISLLFSGCVYKRYSQSVQLLTLNPRKTHDEITFITYDYKIVWKESYLKFTAKGQVPDSIIELPKVFRNRFSNQKIRILDSEVEDAKCLGFSGFKISSSNNEICFVDATIDDKRKRASWDCTGQLRIGIEKDGQCALRVEGYKYYFEIPVYIKDKHITIHSGIHTKAFTWKVFQRRKGIESEFDEKQKRKWIKNAEALLKE